MKKGFILFCFNVVCFSFAVFTETAPDGTAFDLSAEELVENGAGLNAGFEEPFSFTSFNLFVKEKAVVISWKASQLGRNVILYRARAPFDSISSLAGAVPLTYMKDTGVPFIDYPVSGVPFYYAIIEETQLDSGNISFMNGKNTVYTPVEVRGAKTEQGTFTERSTPLPFFNPEKTEKNKPKFFSSETEQALNELTFKDGSGNIEEPPLEREIYVFPIDKKAPDGGEAMELQRILKETFLEKNWTAAEKSFNSFLKIKRTAKVSARTQFYLGQVFFFQKKYDAALLKFLIVQDTYEALSAEWIRYCLVKLADLSE